jgi:hypothetical protein
MAFEGGRLWWALRALIPYSHGHVQGALSMKGLWRQPRLRHGRWRRLNVYCGSPEHALYRRRQRLSVHRLTLSASGALLYFRPGRRHVLRGRGGTRNNRCRSHAVWPRTTREPPKACRRDTQKAESAHAELQSFALFLEFLGITCARWGPAGDPRTLLYLRELALQFTMSTPPAAPASAAVPCSDPTLSVCGVTMETMMQFSGAPSFGPAYPLQLVCTLVGHKDRVWHGAWRE